MTSQRTPKQIESDLRRRKRAPMGDPRRIIKEELLALKMRRPEAVAEVDAAKACLRYIDDRIAWYEKLLAAEHKSDPHE